jgi:hypothetical protein
MDRASISVQQLCIHILYYVYLHIANKKALGRAFQRCRGPCRDHYVYKQDWKSFQSLPASITTSLCSEPTGVEFSCHFVGTWHCSSCHLLCNGFSLFVVIELAITTKSENPLHNGWWTPTWKSWILRQELNSNLRDTIPTLKRWGHRSTLIISGYLPIYIVLQCR